MREFVDADGLPWTAWDTRPTAETHSGRPLSIPDRYTDGWLTFKSESETRRVSPIPSGWNEVPEPELLFMLARAEVVPKLRPPGERRRTER